MNKYLLIAALCVLSCSGTWAGKTSQNWMEEISATRQTYLQKIALLERQLADIDLKWNWVVSVPAEDSIAKAEGWYTFMEARRKTLHTEIVRAKIDQLISYYDDILKFPATEEMIKNKVIPDMEADRKNIAPDYPVHAGYYPASAEEVAALENWIVKFPVQYIALTNSLESLVIFYL